MRNFFTNIALKSRLKNLGIKLTPRISKLRARLFLEEGASVSEISIAPGVLHVGAFTYIRSGCEIGSRVSLGRFCSVGNGVVLGMEKSGHPLHWVSTHPFQHTGTKHTYPATIQETRIGNDVWIGKDAMIMEGVQVGTGAVIGARSVVTRDVPPYAIVAGSPARIVRYRHPPKTIEGLLQTQWWDLDPVFLISAPLDNPNAFISLIQASRPSAYNYASVEVANDASTAQKPTT